MKLRNLSILGLAVLASCASAPKQETMEEMTARVFDVAKQQMIAMDAQLGPKQLPRTISADSTFQTSSRYWWCSGFYPGSLWYVYEYTNDDTVKELAIKNTLKLDSVKFVTDNHDVGFMINCSYGNGYRLTGNEAYKEVLNVAAHSLATRFREHVGCIQSWGSNKRWQCPVIIDNMMNLELLMSVGDMFNNDTLRTIAKTHADTTIKNHFRPDYTSFHVVDYNPETGEVNMKCTHQGYSDESAWARGQAWGLYGYTMMYAFSGEERYLAQAENIAKALIPRLPEDGIPFWDFDAPNGEEHRDTSAGAIMASALVQLSTLTKDAEASKCYLATAEKQMRSMATPKYLAEPSTNCSFLLRRSVGHFKGNSEIDVPLTYADYYYLEALLRYRALNK